MIGKPAIIFTIIVLDAIFMGGNVMKSKLKALIVATTVLVSLLSGCGSDTAKPVNESTPAVEATTETTVEKTEEKVEEPDQPVIEDKKDTLDNVNPEETKEDTPEEPEEFVLTEEYAEEKFNKLVDAYNYLVNQNNIFDNCALYCFETGQPLEPTGGLKTKSGLIDKNEPGAYYSLYISGMIRYYYNYANFDSDYYDLQKYFEENNTEELA